jgi:tetratricopeptide (TPR) repeat protein
MLETIREYALERLAAAPEVEDTRRRHTDYFVDLAEELRPQIEGPRGPTVLNQFEIEHPNLHAALTWTVDHGDAGTGLRLVAAMWKFWWVHRHLSAGREWIERVLALPGDVPPVLRIEARYAAGSIALGQGDHEAARQHGEEGLTLARQIGDAFFLPSMLSLLGNIARERNDEDRAIARFEEALAYIQQRTTDHPLARHQEAMILTRCGGAYADRGAYDHAVSLITTARAIWQERRDSWGLGLAAQELGVIYAAQGRSDQAAAFFRESIGHHREVGDTAGLGAAIAGLASLLAAQGQWSEAARLFGATDAIAEMIGMPNAALIMDGHEEAVGAASRALGEEAFTAAWTSGRALTVEEAVAEAQADRHAHSRRAV